jgi:hypothetical protein
MNFRSGHSRAVVLVGSVALKFPKPTSSWSFVTGMIGNILEAQRWQGVNHPQLARVYWCAPLGLCLIMKRYRQTPYYLTKDEYNALPYDGVDFKPANFAIENNRIVLLDYGNNDFGYKEPLGG